jgi:Tol biopolymer transport system component
LISDGGQGAYSPDGSKIAYWKDRKYWVAGPDGENGQELMTLDDAFEFKGPKWSSDGRVAYLKNEIAIGLPKGSIEVRNGDKTTVVFEATGLLDFWWTSGPDPRLIYWKASTSEEEAYGLFEVHIDERTSRARGEPRLLKHWVGDAPGFMSVSEDGKRIVTTKGSSQSDVHVGGLADIQRNMPPRLTRDSSFDWPATWTKDSSEILFFSDRYGPFNLFRQGESAKGADVEVSGNENVRSAQISPDGQWLLYTVWPVSGPVRMMRRDLQSKGGAQQVLEARGTFAAGKTFSPGVGEDTQMKSPRLFPDFRCPSESSCVLAEAEPDKVVFSFFDPLKGRGDEARSVLLSPARFFWDLSPDGLRVAYGEFGKDRITILTLKDGSSHEVTLDGQENLNSLAWSHDGKDLFVTTWRREGSDLLRVRLHNSDVSYLREETGRWFANPRPSPDGRRFALGVRTTDSNVVLIETQ